MSCFGTHHASFTVFDDVMELTKVMLAMTAMQSATLLHGYGMQLFSFVALSTNIYQSQTQTIPEISPKKSRYSLT